MADIYNKQVVSEFAHNVPGDNGAGKNLMKIGQGWEQKGQQMEQQAKSTYAKVLNSQATDTMEKLYRQYQNDPIALQKAFDDTYNKTMGEIVDDDVKVGFAADCLLKSKTYLSKAYDNKKKLDYRRYKSATFDTIQTNNSLMGMAFSNLVSDTVDADNIANFNLARYSNDQLINTLNEDGTYMFTDEQRKQKQKDYDKIMQHALRDNFIRLAPYEQDSYSKKLDANEITIPTGVSEDKELILSNLSEVVSPEVYDNFKDFVYKTMERSRKITKKASSKGVVLAPEDSMAQAITQISNNDAFKQQWKELSKNLDSSDSVYALMDYRNSLTGSFNEDGISESDYKNRMAETIRPLIERVENLKPRKYRIFNDSFKVGAFRINELMQFQNQPEEVKAAAYELLYNNFAKYNIDPTSNTVDSDLIDKCVNETVQQLAVNADPRLLGVKAQRVLTGANMINYNTTEQPKKAGGLNYVLKKDPKTGIIYKFYKNADGSVDENSAWMRL